MTPKLPRADPDDLNPADLDALHQYVDGVFHNRVNLLLVAEGLFLAALSQVWGDGGLVFEGGLCVLGLVVTKLFGETLETLYRRTRALAKVRMVKSKTYRYYMQAIPGSRRQTQNLAARLPDLFVLAWGVLLLAVIARAVLDRPPAWLGGSGCPCCVAAWLPVPT